MRISDWSSDVCSSDLRRLAAAHGVAVRATFLGAHALPPEYAGRSGEYIERVCKEMLPALHEAGLVDAVEVFCEQLAFSLAETERVFEAAQALLIPVKLHAVQLSDMGGSAMDARRRALSFVMPDPFFHSGCCAP